MHYFSGKGCFEFLESMHYCIGILKEMIADEYKQNSSLETDIGKGITEIISGVSKQKKTFKQNLKSVKNKDAKILLEQSLKRTKIKRTEGKKSQYSLSKNFILD